MTAAPALSITIPVLNGAAYLGNAIESALRAIQPGDEVLVCDNGSSDGSARIARTFEGRPGYRFVQFSRGEGMGFDWTRAVRATAHSFVKLLPCDDELEAGSLDLERQSLAESGVSLVASPKILSTASGKTAWRISRFAPGRVRLADAARRILTSPSNPIGEPGSVLFRKENFDAFDNELIYYCDIDCWYRLLQTGDMMVTNRPAARFRAQAGSLSLRNFKKIEADFRRFHAKHTGRGKLSFTLAARLRLTTWARQSVLSILASL